VKLQFKKRRLIPVALAILVLVVGSGVAYAYWSAGGTGTGTGSMASPASATVNQVATPTLAPMFPGDIAQATQVTVHNPSASQSVHVTTVSISNVTTDKTGCTVLDFLIGAAVTPWTAAGTDIAAGGTTATVTGPTIHFFNDTTRSQDACKGAVVTLTYSVS
jgi:hypothetical protein